LLKISKNRNASRSGRNQTDLSASEGTIVDDSAMFLDLISKIMVPLVGYKVAPFLCDIGRPGQALVYIMWIPAFNEDVYIAEEVSRSFIG
jgi:hypothetical protein